MKTIIICPCGNGKYLNNIFTKLFCYTSSISKNKCIHLKYLQKIKIARFTPNKVKNAQSSIQYGSHVIKIKIRLYTAIQIIQA